MIAKYSCGCIGVPSLVNEDGKVLIIEPCDLSGDDCWEPYNLNFRDMQGKECEPVPQEKVLRLIKALGGLLSDGYKFPRVKDLLT